MKEFEKWWDTLICSNNETIKHISKITWRTALEMILKQELIDDDGRFVPSHIIREELSGNQTNNSTN